MKIFIKYMVSNRCKMVVKEELKKTLGTTSHFEGIILSMTGITFQTGASITGRALAQTAVVLDATAVT